MMELVNYQLHNGDFKTIKAFDKRHLRYLAEAWFSDIHCRNKT